MYFKEFVMSQRWLHSGSGTNFSEKRLNSVMSSVPNLLSIFGEGGASVLNKIGREGYGMEISIDSIFSKCARQPTPYPYA